MRSFGRLLRTTPTVLYALISVLILPFLLAVIFGASSSAQTTTVVFLAIGVSVLIRAYRAGDDR